MSGLEVEDRDFKFQSSPERKLHHLAKEVESQLTDSEERVKKAHKDAFAEWLMLCSSQQSVRKDSHLEEIPLQEFKKEESRQGLLQDVKDDIIDYVKLTHKNITAMKEFSNRFFQKVESSLSALILEIYQDEKGAITIENELNDLLSVTKEWTTKSVIYFESYEKVFRTIPMEKAIERIRAKYGSMAQLRQEIGQALTPSNIFQYTAAGLGPIATASVVLGCTIGFANPIGICVVVGMVVLGALICGGLYMWNKRTKKKKVEELERLQTILNKFANQFETLGSKIDTEAFKTLLDILRNIETTTKEFEAVFLPTSDEVQDEEYDFCAICHDSFDQDEKKDGLRIRRVAPQPCAKHRSHHCHSTCLASWEQTKDPIKKCPTCRKDYQRTVNIEINKIASF